MQQPDLAAIHDAGYTALSRGDDHGANAHLPALTAAWQQEGTDAAPELARVQAWWDGLEDAMRAAQPERYARQVTLRFL